MIICNDGHEEICYNDVVSGWPVECPLCKLVAELEEAEYEIGELDNQIDDLERELGNLTG